MLLLLGPELPYLCLCSRAALRLAQPGCHALVVRSLLQGKATSMDKHPLPWGMVQEPGMLAVKDTHTSSDVPPQHPRTRHHSDITAVIQPGNVCVFFFCCFCFFPSFQGTMSGCRIPPTKPPRQGLEPTPSGLPFLPGLGKQNHGRGEPLNFLRCCSSRIPRG